MERLKIFVIVAWGSLALVGCTHSLKPGSVPQIDLNKVGTYDKKYSVDIINDYEDATENIFGSIGLHKYSANYNLWTQFFVDQYKDELKKRNVVVSKDSPNKIKIKISDFAMMQGMWVIRVNMKVRLEKSGEDWRKEWVESDVSGWSGGRAFGSVMHNAIQKLLEDSEVLNKMRI